MTPCLHPEWQQLLLEIWESDWFANLDESVRAEYQAQTVYPPAEKIWAALDACPPSQTKVVILGQDPYHGPNQAMGLSFSVPSTTAIPPSLANIFREIKTDLNIKTLPSGDLTRWAQQGVLLLNTHLTVRAGQAASHQHLGWEQCTDLIIKTLSLQKSGLVFLLWGNFAQRKRELIDETKHHLLMAPHPSPLSAYRGWWGCQHFSRTNELLCRQGLDPINWQ